MAFAQLTYRESLRDIEACLRARQNKLYHMGIHGTISKNNLAYTNEQRDWRIYADFAQVLIHQARTLYKDDTFGIELDQTVYALDSTTIDLCLSLFPWARFRKHKGAIKLHTLMDLRGSIPSFIKITDGKVHDVHMLDVLIPEPGSFMWLIEGIWICPVIRAGPITGILVIRAKHNLLPAGYIPTRSIKQPVLSVIKRLCSRDTNHSETTLISCAGFVISIPRKIAFGLSH